MDIKSLIEESRRLLEQAQEAINNGDMDKYTELKAESEKVTAKAVALKDTQKAQGVLDGLVEPEPVPPATPEQEPKKTVKAEPIRLPFEIMDDGEPVGDENSDNKFNKGIYTLRYGNMDAATQAVIKDIYGGDYYQMRDEQKGAFEKYIRFGEYRLGGKDYALLKQLILLPQTLKQEIAAGASVREIKASTLVERQGDLGGYLVPEDYRVDIISRLMGMTIIRPRARVVTTNRDAVEWPKLEGGNDLYTSAVRVTWIEETPQNASVAATNPTFGMLRIPAHTVMARTDLSKNLLEDSAFNMVDIVNGLFAEAMAINEDTMFITGTGQGTPEGILGNRSGAEAIPVEGIESVNTGASSTLLADGLFDLVYSLPAQYRGAAAHIGARATHRDVRKLKDSQNQYLWAAGLQPGEPPLLLGYPFLESENMPAVSINGYPMVFGDLRGYMIVDRVGMTVQRVEDTTTTGQNTVALFARRRVGGKVIEPWRLKAHKVSA